MGSLPQLLILASPLHSGPHLSLRFCPTGHSPKSFPRIGAYGDLSSVSFSNFMSWLHLMLPPSLTSDRFLNKPWLSSLSAFVHGSLFLPSPSHSIFLVNSTLELCSLLRWNLALSPLHCHYTLCITSVLMSNPGYGIYLFLFLSTPTAASSWRKGI